MLSHKKVATCTQTCVLVMMMMAMMTMVMTSQRSDAQKNIRPIVAEVFAVAMVAVVAVAVWR